LANMLCPKCIFEGRESELLKPEKTAEGWIQHCVRGHKLYVWYHIVELPDVTIDILDHGIYPSVDSSNN